MTIELVDEKLCQKRRITKRNKRFGRQDLIEKIHQFVKENHKI